MNLISALRTVLLVLLLSGPFAVHADWLYFVSRTNETLQRLDPDTLKLQAVGKLGIDYQAGGMAWDPVARRLLLIADPTIGIDSPVLYEIDPLTGAWELEGAIALDQDGVGRQLYGLEYIAESGRLLVAYLSKVVEVDRTTLATDEVANTDLNDAPFAGLAYDSTREIVYVVDSSGKPYRVDIRTGKITAECPNTQYLEGGFAYDPERQVFWQSNLDGTSNQFFTRFMAPACGVVPQDDDVGPWTDNLAFVPGDDIAFGITAGFNDAWFNPATPGQGFMIAVFPAIKQVFLTWFTYDVERPPQDVTAMLGEPGHRWLTAQGPYDGDTAVLTVFVTSGGVFDSDNPPATTDQDGDGTITLKFSDCENGTIEYDIESLDLQGEVPIERIALDNVPACEALFATD